MSTATVASGKRSVGRPPRFTLEQVVEAACELGLDNVDMGAVARKLGVGIATLYGYVEGRDHLVRLTAQRLAGRSGIADEGQSWQDALREHAHRSFVTYSDTPQLITQLMSGELGDLADSRHSDALLAILIDRGLHPQRAMAVFLETNQLVIGAAVGAAYSQSIVRRAGSDSGFLAEERAKCEARGLNALRACLDAGSPLDSTGRYHLALERLIAAQEAGLAA